MVFEGSDNGAPAPVESAKSSLNLASIVQANETGKMGPAQIADSIIKNNGFGHGEDRDKIESSLGSALTGAMKNGDESAHKLVAEVNKELTQKGSSLKLDDIFSGSGGGGGGKNGLVESHQETTGAFVITDKNSKQFKDGLPLDASYDSVQKDGKLIGERSSVDGENGGGAGGWGKQPSFILHEMEFHDSGSGEGGSKGGISPMKDSDDIGGSKGGRSPMGNSKP